MIFPGGKIGFAELKRPGGKTTKLQDAQICKLKMLGCFVKVLDSVEDIENFIKELENGTSI